jgi:outer membrane biosynthesis protein TonB
MLDALVNRQGQLVDIQVVRGAPPFLDKALGAVQTWSFLPAHRNRETAETRIGIAFQFAANAGAMRSKPQQPPENHSHDFSMDTRERGPLPSVIVEPQSPAISGSDANVILSAQIDAQGHPASIKVVRGEESLGPAVASAVSQWQFTPAKHAGENCASTFIAVEVMRGGALPTHTKSAAAAHSLLQ